MVGQGLPIHLQYTWFIDRHRDNECVWFIIEATITTCISTLVYETTSE